jgi:hypothetical protein
MSIGLYLLSFRDIRVLSSVGTESRVRPLGVREMAEIMFLPTGTAKASKTQSQHARKYAENSGIANLVINTDADQIVIAEVGAHTTDGLPPN